MPPSSRLLEPERSPALTSVGLPGALPLESAPKHQHLDGDDVDVRRHHVLGGNHSRDDEHADRDDAQQRPRASARISIPYRGFAMQPLGGALRGMTLRATAENPLHVSGFVILKNHGSLTPRQYDARARNRPRAPVHHNDPLKVLCNVGSDRNMPRESLLNHVDSWGA